MEEDSSIPRGKPGLTGVDDLALQEPCLHRGYLLSQQGLRENAFSRPRQAGGVLPGGQQCCEGNCLIAPCFPCLTCSWLAPAGPGQEICNHCSSEGRPSEQSKGVDEKVTPRNRPAPEMKISGDPKAAVFELGDLYRSASSAISAALAASKKLRPLNLLTRVLRIWRGGGASPLEEDPAWVHDPPIFKRLSPLHHSLSCLGYQLGPSTSPRCCHDQSS
jgi:hypothetical protein